LQHLIHKGLFLSTVNHISYSIDTHIDKKFPFERLNYKYLFHTIPMPFSSAKTQVYSIHFDCQKHDLPECANLTLVRFVLEFAISVRALNFPLVFDASNNSTDESNSDKSLHNF